MALMCFHASRSESRLTPEGGMILLAEQDRKKWNAALIAEGNAFMNLAAFGDELSTYHLEAAIAYEHCSAESFEKTNWALVVDYYQRLCNLTSSPVTLLNKAIAVMQLNGPAVALEELNKIDRKKLTGYYLYHSLPGEIHSKLNKYAAAKQYFQEAITLTESETERKMLYHKIDQLELNK
jgi:RNA polymerase sigma-70 factor (ECF subfamily)